MEIAALDSHEEELLHRIAIGDTIGEIAHDRMVTKNAVYLRLHSIRERMAARSTAHAVALHTFFCTDVHFRSQLWNQVYLREGASDAA